MPRLGPTSSVLSPKLALDNLLEVLEQRDLSPMELRVLLWLSDREATPSQLSEALAGPRRAISHASRSLSMRGLVRRRFEWGPSSRLVFDITPAGRLLLDPLVQAFAETGAAMPRDPA